MSNQTGIKPTARDCGLNPKQVIDRVGAMAKSLIAETDPTQA